MGLVIVWTEFALYELKSIYEYYKVKASPAISKKIIRNISISVKVLPAYPEIGQIEPEFDDFSNPVRYIISSNYKILYRVIKVQNRIEILDVFDTRQNPAKITRNK